MTEVKLKDTGPIEPEHKEGGCSCWVGWAGQHQAETATLEEGQSGQTADPQERSPGQDHHLYLFINTPSEILLTYCTETLGAVLRDILHILYDITCIKIDVYCL